MPLENPEENQDSRREIWEKMITSEDLDRLLEFLEMKAKGDIPDLTTLREFLNTYYPIEPGSIISALKIFSKSEEGSFENFKSLKEFFQAFYQFLGKEIFIDSDFLDELTKLIQKISPAFPSGTIPDFGSLKTVLTGYQGKDETFLALQAYFILNQKNLGEFPSVILLLSSFLKLSEEEKKKYLDQSPDLLRGENGRIFAGPAEEFFEILVTEFQKNPSPRIELFSPEEKRKRRGRRKKTNLSELIGEDTGEDIEKALLDAFEEGPLENSS